MQRETFAKGMTRMSEVFQRQLSELLLEDYWRSVNHMTDEAFVRAIDDIIDTRKFYRMPLPAEIRDHEAGGKEERAILAWDQTIKAIRKHDVYPSLVFEDKGIHAVVESMGGWERLCEKTVEEMTWARKEFLELYKIFEGRDMGAPDKLVGAHEANNDRGGFEVKPPVFIPRPNGVKRDAIQGDTEDKRAIGSGQ